MTAPVTGCRTALAIGIEYTPHSELRTSSIKNLEPSNKEFHKNISRLTSQE
jgi:hypothetical protein